MSTIPSGWNVFLDSLIHALLSRFLLSPYLCAYPWKKKLNIVRDQNYEEGAELLNSVSLITTYRVQMESGPLNSLKSFENLSHVHNIWWFFLV